MQSVIQQKDGRFVLLDVMRAVAVFMMIQGHSIDALFNMDLLPGDSVVIQMWNHFRGITAPIFLFGSGFAYVIATTRKSVDGRMPFPLLLKRLRWLLLLFLLGAAMHAPAPSLSEFAHASERQWDIFLRVDILRSMAVSLLLLLAMFLFTRTLTQILITASVLAVFFSVGAPFVHEASWVQELPRWLRGYFSLADNSYFPLFPFSGYLFAGAAASAIYLKWQREWTYNRLSMAYGAIGGSLLVIALLGEQGFEALFPPLRFWASSPFVFLLRLANVLIMWSVAAYLLNHVKRFPRTLVVMGQHTLAIYVSHVVLIYGSPWSKGLNSFLGSHALSYLPMISVIVVIAFLSAGMAITLDYCKRRQKKPLRLVQGLAGSLAILAILFS